LNVSAASAHKRTESPAPPRVPQLLHLPTWSRLSVATRQHGPLGHGGDFFEIIQHRDGYVSVVVADVCGNGPRAAIPVSRLRWLLRQELARGAPPGEVLAMLNQAILVGNAPDLFVTAVCVRVDPQSGHAVVSSAGHLGPFVKRARGDVEELAMPGGVALGIAPDQIYGETQVELESEDALVLVTDGITDPLGTASSPLGQAGLLAELARASPSPESICGALLHASASPIEHDATVVVLQLPRRHRRVTPVRRSAR
jgi:serine phosphatase RsbU (regulator of sigma subunit)